MCNPAGAGGGSPCPSPRYNSTMKCYPLGIAAHIAIALDCIRRGDLDGAASALSRAAVLSRGAQP